MNAVCFRFFALTVGNGSLLSSSDSERLLFLHKVLSFTGAGMRDSRAFGIASGVVSQKVKWTVAQFQAFWLLDQVDGCCEEERGTLG